MAVAFDNYGESAIGTTTRTITGFTPVGTPRGIIALIIQGNGTDEISGVTYGGTGMTEVTTSSPNLKTTGQAGAVYAYFLGADILTGARDVVATATGSTANKQLYAISLTADANTEVVDHEIINTDAAENPSVTLSHGGRTCFDALAFISGQAAVGGVAPPTGWGSHNETDGGAFTFGCYSHNTPGTSDVAAGLDQTSEDAIVIAVAISEVVAGGGGMAPSRRNTLMGVGR